MARKKKEIVEFKFTPSKYQERIFDFIEHGSGNLLIEACAGAGKTTTIVQALKLIPKDKTVLFSAFNKDIVKALTKKTKEYDNVSTMTIHSLGYSMLKRNFVGMEITIEPFKYDAFIRKSIHALSSLNVDFMKHSERFTYMNNIKKLVEFGRFYLAQTCEDLDVLRDRYGIDLLGDEEEVAIKVMDWGKGNFSTIDFTDMVWLPNVLYLKPLGLQYDYIMVDEVQDLDKSKRELLLKCVKMGTRICAVGDPNQCIYSFSGSDPQSFEEFRNIPNTHSFPLSISYRCADSIVDNAKRIVPMIERNSDARAGEIRENVSLDEVMDGDMILCRNNAPLVEIYGSLLKDGKKCFILGKDIGTNLCNVVKSYSQEELNQDCLRDGLFIRLYDNLFTTRNKVMEKSGIDEPTAMTSDIVVSKLDTIKTLETLSEGLKTSTELISKIESIFKDSTNSEGIMLSTIHKAKGLESDRVFIAYRSMMPSKSAKKPWEKEQEKNLMYVAYTRAKNFLGFLSEDDKRYDISDKANMASLKRIEELVQKVLTKSTNPSLDIEMARRIIERAQLIDKISSHTKTVDINTVKPTSEMFGIRNKKLKSKKPISWERFLKS